MDHHHPAHAIAIAVMATCANAGDVGQPPRVERPGPVGNRNGEAVHDVIIALSQLLSHGVLDQDEGSPQASQATVERTLGEHSREQMPQMFSYITHDAALAFPWHAAAPRCRETQAPHLGVAHLCRWPTTGGHVGLDVALVTIVHDDVQCDKEGFEIEFHGHVSFGERVDMAVDSRRNLLLLSSEQGSICIKRLGSRSMSTKTNVRRVNSRPICSPMRPYSADYIVTTNFASC